MSAGDEFQSECGAEAHSERFKGRAEPWESTAIHPGSRDLFIQPGLPEIPMSSATPCWRIRRTESRHRTRVESATSAEACSEKKENLRVFSVPGPRRSLAIERVAMHPLRDRRSELGNHGRATETRRPRSGGWSDELAVPHGIGGFGAVAVVGEHGADLGQAADPTTSRLMESLIGCPSLV